MEGVCIFFFFSIPVSLWFLVSESFIFSLVYCYERNYRDIFEPEVGSRFRIAANGRKGVPPVFLVFLSTK